MPKIILDTNVIVPALIQKSYPYLIIKDIVFEHKAEICMSLDLAEEYAEVLNRQKFSKFPDFVNTAKIILSDIQHHAIWYSPVKKLHVIKDVGDNKLLELADVSSADYLITGNTNDFTMSSFQNTRIVTPKIYWEIHVDDFKI